LVLLNDNREKEFQRNQLLALLLMTILLVVWAIFFIPTPPPPGEQPAPVEVREAIEPETLSPPVRDDLSPTIAELPPVAEPLDPAEDEIRLSDEHLELVFTRVGGRLKAARVLLGHEGIDSVQLVPEWTDVPDSEAVYPLGLQFTRDYLGEELNLRRWEAEVNEAGTAVTFSLALPQGEVRKRFALGDQARVVDMEVAYTNTADRPRVLGVDAREPAYSVMWGPNVTSGDLGMRVAQEVVWRTEEANVHHPTARLDTPPAGERYSERVLNPDWLAIKSAYFAVALRPDFEQSEGWAAAAGPQQFVLGLGVPRMVVEPGETAVHSFQVYLGPTSLSALRQAWPGLDSLLEFFTMFRFMDSFAKLLLNILNWFYTSVYANYGFAIIFLTILVRTVMFPLTWKSMKSMKKIQKLAPELEKIKAEVGDDQQEMQKRMMQLYREHGANPVAGCLPMLLQMPIFIALYNMLWQAFELRRAPFAFWIRDLSEPDALFQLPFSIPVPFTQTDVTTFNLLPILMAVAMWLSIKLMPTSGAAINPQQKIIMRVMPVLFSVICYNMASGLTLYILVSTLVGIAQNYAIHVSDLEVDKKPKKKKSSPASRSKSVYTVAQARKRQAAREAKRERRARANRPDPKSKEGVKRK